VRLKFSIRNSCIRRESWQVYFPSLAYPNLFQLILLYPTLPHPTLPYRTLPYPTLPLYPSLPYLTLACILAHPILPHPTPPYPTLPYPFLPTLSYPTLPYTSLPYPTYTSLPYPTLLYPTLPYPILPYATLSYSIIWPALCVGGRNISEGTVGSKLALPVLFTPGSCPLMVPTSWYFLQLQTYFYYNLMTTTKNKKCKPYTVYMYGRSVKGSKLKTDHQKGRKMGK